MLFYKNGYSFLKNILVYCIIRMSSTRQWKQFVELYAEKNRHLTRNQVLQQAKKPFQQLKKYYQRGGESGEQKESYPPSPSLVRSNAVTGDEILYKSIKSSYEHTMRNIIFSIIFKAMTDVEYLRFHVKQEMLSLDKQISKFDLEDPEDRKKVELFLRILGNVIDKEYRRQELRDVLKRNRIYINVVDELKNRTFEEFLLKFTDTDGNLIGRKMTDDEYHNMQLEENFVNIALSWINKLYDKWDKEVAKEKIKILPLRRSKETVSRDEVLQKQQEEEQLKKEDQKLKKYYQKLSQYHQKRGGC